MKLSNKELIAIDTEYDTRTRIPFIATTCDQQLRTYLYDLKNKSDFKKFKQIAESNNTIKIFHNTPADICACSTIGIKIPHHDIDLIEDTIIMAGLLQSAYSPRGLKPLARVYLKDPCEEEKLLKKVVATYKRKAKKENMIFGWDQIPKKILEPYAIKDAVLTIKLFYLWHDAIKEFQDLYDIEKRLIRINVDMMNNGMRINRKFVKKQIIKNDEHLNIIDVEMRQILRDNKVKFFVEKSYKIRGKSPEKASARMTKQITAFCDKHSLKLISSVDQNNKRVYKLKEKFSPTSSLHMQKAIKKLNIPIREITKTGKLATDADTLLQYKDHRFIELKLEHSGLSKQQSTYYGPLYNWYTSKSNDRAHFSVWQSGAKTGRYSVELAQTIPRTDQGADKASNRIREAFIPAENHFIACYDYAQIELRIFASYSKSKTLIDAFLNNKDPYIAMAQKIFTKDELAKNPKELRRIAKTIALGIIYGMGTDKLMIALVSESGGTFSITRGKAADILQKFHQVVPVREYVNELTRELYRTGSIRLTFNSELMKFSRIYNIDKDDAYKGPNALCQGSAAYCLKMAMLRLYEYLDKYDLHKYIKLLMVVHDEFLIEIHNTLNDSKILKQIKTTLEDVITFTVPITAAIKVSDKSWGLVKEIKI